MKTIINRIIPCFLALLLLEGCTNDVFSLLGNKQQNPQMSIEAWTETALTKTLLSGEPDDSVRSICFLPLDSIAYSADLGEFEPFVNLGNDTLPYATFTGNLVEANMYFAVYPWKQAVNLNSDTLLVLNLPYVQQYKAGGGANGAYPMVSWSYDTDLYFKNLCGLLKLNLQGNAVVTSLSLCAPGLAGLAGVDMRYQGVPRLIMPTPPAYDTLRLDCGQGVQLDSLQATPFYFVLPPALYDSMTLIVRTSDQQQMTTTTRNLRIVRSSVTPTSVIEFVSDDKPNPPSDTIWDVQGNVYNTVVIGNQTWTTGNLRSTLLNDGTEIPLVTDNSDWSSLTTPGYCWYSNDPTSHSDYGPLYNWFTIETAKICPLGWHIPDNAEWTVLINNLGGLGLASFKMKETGTMYWSSPNEGATNESGFSARGSGRREYYDGQFGFMNRTAYWWSNTQYDTDLSYALYLSNVNTNVESYYFDKAYGFSVRCIKDSLAPLAVTTSPVSSITASSAQSGGNITSDGGFPITARGLCWNSSGDPTTADNKTEEGSGTGEFTSTMTGLQPNTTYYVRAYASSDFSTSYGETLSFNTLSDSGGSGILLEDNFDLYPSEQDWYFDIGDGLFVHEDSKAILMTNYNRYTVKFYSKLQRSVNDGTLTFVSNMLTYEDNNTAYGPLSRGLVSGADRNNAIEFINLTGSIIQARTVSNGVATTTDYNVGASVNNYYDYKIVASNTQVDFYFNNLLIASHTTNIPLVMLNVYFDTSSWAGNVPVYIDYVRLELAPY